jgi:hypothetical protein
MNGDCFEGEGNNDMDCLVKGGRKFRRESRVWPANANGEDVCERPVVFRIKKNRRRAQEPNKNE